MTQRPRKRSHHAVLALMMPATGLLLTACSPPEPQVKAVVYNSVQECQEKNPDAKEQCLTDYQQAAALHPKVAPKYQNLQECEADFGVQRCEIAPERRAEGGSFFMPMMMGYMASQMFSRPLMGQGMPYASAPPTSPRDNVRRDDNNQTSGFAGGGGVSTQPLYRSRDDAGTFRTADNYAVASKTGAVSVDPQAVSGARAGGVRSVGGFGSTAASHASAGS